MLRFCMLAMLVGLCGNMFAGSYSIQSNGILIKENMSLTVKVTANSAFKNYDRIGFYVQKADGTYRYESFDRQTANGKEFNFGNFTAGEKVGLFVGKGDTVLDKFFLHENHNGKVTYVGWESGGYESISLSIKLASGEYTGGTTGGDDKPSGQPLPGVLTGILVSGGIVYAARKRKKSNAVAC